MISFLLTLMLEVINFSNFNNDLKYGGKNPYQSRRTSNAISLGNRIRFPKRYFWSFSEPKPHTNTVSTILKILMEKEFVGHKVHGRQHEYFPLISKETYSGKSIKSLVKKLL